MNRKWLILLPAVAAVLVFFFVSRDLQTVAFDELWTWSGIGVDRSAEQGPMKEIDAASGPDQRDEGDDAYDAYLHRQQCLEQVEAAVPNPMSAYPSTGFSGRVEAVAAMLAPVRDRLGVSPDPEHRLAAVLLAPLGQVEPGQLVADLPAGSGNVLVAWHRLRICIDSPVGTCAGEEALAEELISLARDNSEVWAQLAVSRMRRGDETGALAAMRQAAAASESSPYWGETMALIDRALVAATDLDWAWRASLAPGAFNHPIYGELEAMCSEATVAAGDWGDACLQLGDLMGREHETELGRSLGRSFQVRVAQARGDEQMLQTLQQKFADESVPDVGRYASQMLDFMGRYSPDLFYRFLDDVRAYGETEARAIFVNRELDGFLDQLGLSECGPVLLAD